MDYEQCLYSEEEKKLMGLMGEGQKELKAGLSKTFFSSRLIMNSRQLWNWHQRHKFLRAKVSSDILKFRVLEIAFSGVFKRSFPLRTPYCFVGIHALLGTMPSNCPRCSTTLHGSNISQI